MPLSSSSLSLTGNKNDPATDASGKKCDQHTMVYTSDRISSHPHVGLTRGGMILVVMLSGGDYDEVIDIDGLRNNLF